MKKIVNDASDANERMLNVFVNDCAYQSVIDLVLFHLAVSFYVASVFDRLVIAVEALVSVNGDVMVASLLRCVVLPSGVPFPSSAG